MLLAALAAATPRVRAESAARPPAPDAALGVVLAGTVCDGTASARNVSSFQKGGHDWIVPLAGAAVEIRALGEEGASWTVETDAAGAFRLQTGLARLPDETPFVAAIERDGTRLYSPSFDPTAQDLKVFVYPAGANKLDVRTVSSIVHQVVRRDEHVLLRVQYQVEFWNFSGQLFTGTTARGGSREVFRIPLPPGAEVTRREGPVPGTQWRSSRDGRFLIIDEPVPGLADIMHDRQHGVARNVWTAEYHVPAPAFFTMTYPVVLPHLERQRASDLGGFRVYVLHEGMEVEGAKGEAVGAMEIEAVHLEKATREKTNPVDGTSGEFDVYLPTYTPQVGQEVLVPVQISDVTRGTVSRKALFWHAGTVLIALGAVLTGLLISRKGPPPEAVIAGLSSEQVLDRIAELDERYERREIPEKEYRRYREALVAIAAEELQGVESAAPRPGAPAGAVDVSDATRGLLARIRALDDPKAQAGPEAIQERAHLLEALYKSLSSDLGG